LFRAPEVAVMGSLSSVPCRVLIVDGEPCTRSVCRLALEAEGYKCDEAPDGAAGLEAACSGDYDLLLLDIDVPQVPGPEVLRRVRELPGHRVPRVILMSGRAVGAAMARRWWPGADHYLTKPFDDEQLSSHVRTALAVQPLGIHEESARHSRTS
jgi:DNA-binding response OmpR family regulator